MTESSSSSSHDLWTEQQEKVTKSWGEEATSYAWLHHKCSGWFNRWDYILTFIVLIMPIIVGSSIFITYTTIKWVQIIYGVLLFLTSFVVALQTYLSWGKRATSHEDGAQQWQIFADDIQGELVLPRHLRSHGFFHKAKGKRRTLLTTYPQIISRYEEQYKKKFGNLPVAKPFIADGIPEIQINTDDTNDTKATVPTELIQKENTDRYAQYQLERAINNGIIN
jgi:hypothetical protein